jgi:hypothetical protein
VNAAILPQAAACLLLGLALDFTAALACFLTSLQNTPSCCLTLLPHLPVSQPPCRTRPSCCHCTTWPHCRTCLSHHPLAGHAILLLGLALPDRTAACLLPGLALTSLPHLPVSSSLPRRIAGHAHPAAWPCTRPCCRTCFLAPLQDTPLMLPGLALPYLLPHLPVSLPLPHPSAGHAHPAATAPPGHQR